MIPDGQASYGRTAIRPYTFECEITLRLRNPVLFHFHAKRVAMNTQRCGSMRECPAVVFECAEDMTPFDLGQR